MAALGAARTGFGAQSPCDQETAIEAGIAVAAAQGKFQQKKLSQVGFSQTGISNH
jgi:hypothetical protein